MFQDYGTMSGYSTLKSGPGPATGRDQENLDYETLSRSGIVSEEELEKWVHIIVSQCCYAIHNMSRETGAGPRGDRSRFIETDSGLVQSKYR